MSDTTSHSVFTENLKFELLCSTRIYLMKLGLYDLLAHVVTEHLPKYQTIIIHESQISIESIPEVLGCSIEDKFRYCHQW